MTTRTINTLTLTAAAVAAITNVATCDAHAERATLAALPILQAAFKGKHRDDVEQTIKVNYAAVIGLTLKVQGTGRVVFTAEQDTAKRACNRFIARILGDKADSVEMEVPADVLALAQKLIKLCATYDCSQAKLIATAIAAAKA